MSEQRPSKQHTGSSFIATVDGTQIFYKDWGTGRPLVFHHGWPLSADDWDAQMMFFLGQGYRVIAHDRRGHGRSTQTVRGNDMDTYAADVAELVTALDLENAVHIGHSTGSGEVTRMYPAMARVGWLGRSSSARSRRPSCSRIGTPTVSQKKSWTESATARRITARSSIEILRFRSMALTAQVRPFPREFERIGGARA